MSVKILDNTILKRRLNLWIYLFLTVATFIVYWQVINHGFVNYDDESYVTRNTHVQAGLTLKGVIWSFRTLDVSNWHPLTWLSHMLVCELFGINPLWHHLTNLVLHLASVLLLFRVFLSMSGNPWQSGFVAALFALHPLNVEPVAWAAERKGILCTFFWMLTLWSYLRYLERPKIPNYLLILFFFVLGFMAKPMIVTLPFVLLLLDYWPLRRFQSGKPVDGRSSGAKSFDPRLVWEKIPLLFLVVLMSIIGYFAQQSGGALSTMEALPFGIRISNALVSYVLYLWKMLWPSNLSVFYPHEAIPGWQAIGAGLFLAAVSLLVVAARKHRPYLAVGWFWYMGTFVPVIQIVQVGIHSMADRYAYIPLIGIFIMVAWGVPDLLARSLRAKRVLVSASVLCLILLAVITWKQLGHWANSMTLFQHSLRVVSNNYVGHNGLARVFEAQGKTAEAISHFEEALRIKPGFTHGRYNLARILAAQGKQDDAIRLYSEVLERRPGFVQARINLANILAEQGRLDEAIEHYNQALQVKGGNANAHYNLGNTLALAGKSEEAIKHYLGALRLDPDHANAHYNLGNALAEQGKAEDAIRHYSEALRVRPDFVEAMVNLGNALAKGGSTEAAITHYTEALRLRPDYVKAHWSLGFAFLEQGRRDEAVKHFQEVTRLMPDDPYAHYSLGNALSEDGKGEAAIRHYSEALRIKPDFAEAHMSLADALAEQGETVPAIEHYLESVRINPAVTPVAYYNMACIYALQNMVEQSIACLDKAIKSGFQDWHLVRTDQDLKNIRGTSSYKKLTSGN